MKISELIKKLKDALENGGDEDVVIVVTDSDGSSEEAENITYVSLDGYITIEL